MFQAGFHYRYPPFLSHRHIQPNIRSTNTAGPRSPDVFLVFVCGSKRLSERIRNETRALSCCCNNAHDAYSLGHGRQASFLFKRWVGGYLSLDSNPNPDVTVTFAAFDSVKRIDWNRNRIRSITLNDAAFSSVRIFQIIYSGMKI